MSLDWNISKIPNHSAVCFVDDGKETKLSGLTRTLIFATMHVGIPVITEENAAEFFVRCHAYENVYGSWRCSVPVEGGAIVDQPIQPGEIRQHIGLRTNAGRLSEHKFAEQLTKALQEAAQRKWDNFMELLAVPTPDAKDPVPKG